MISRQQNSHKMDEVQIKPVKAVLIFGFSTLYFFLLLFTLLPFIKNSFIINPALYWFITGYFLFIPLFVFALAKVKAEGSREMKTITSALGISSFSKNDWRYAVAGLMIVFAASGLIFGISAVLNKYYGIRPLTTTPWFMEMQPFQGSERLLLLVWLPMFFFNIMGEELLWRGYIQKRLQGKYSWLLCSFLWLMFHLPFGFDLIIVLIPVIIVIPYSFYKTGNTMVGIFIHSVYNGPIFVAVALGLIK